MGEQCLVFPAANSTQSRAEFCFGRESMRGFPISLYRDGDTLQQLSESQNILWFRTVHPRLASLLSDNLLLYGTGAVAAGRVYGTANYSLRGVIAGIGGAGFGFACPANFGNCI